MKNYRPGDKVQIINGVDTGKIGIVVHPREIKLNNRGIPTNTTGGDYKRPDWKREIPLKLPNGSYVIMFKRFVNSVVEESINLEQRISRLEEKVFSESSIRGGLKIKGATSIDNRYIGNYLRSKDYTHEFDEGSKSWLVAVHEEYLDEIQEEFEADFDEENINATITFI